MKWLFGHILIGVGWTAMAVFMILPIGAHKVPLLGTNTSRLGFGRSDGSECVT
jgi:hypothetical protein